ncbi:MAG: iron export ABC transporter permease subunit FetB [bacterium]|nr:iron export ABC transporter permease subunit FetB [bacterium]
MDEPIIAISLTQLSLTLLLAALVVAISFYERLGLERDFGIALIRTVLQLFLMGYVLEYIFAVERWYLVVLMVAFMVGTACQAGVGRLKQRDARLFSIMAVSILAGAGVTIVTVTEVVLQIHPWYNPRYLIPLSGMIIGNAMNSATLGAERFRSELRLRKNEIETLLSLGFDVRRAAASARRQAISAALLPTLNSMMVVGVVTLPGMMTGQILSGTSPFIATRYQIVVMVMISAAVMVSSFLMVRLLTHRFFTSAHQIRYYLLRKS